MKNSFGDAVTFSIFGESHGPAIGMVIDGLAPGIPINQKEIAEDMNKRRAIGAISTARQEEDRVNFLSGVYNGFTTGTTLTIMIYNQDTRSGDYTRTQDLLRPGHADYTGLMKYNGFNDPRGGGHFSGRLTAPVVAAGAICRSILKSHGITIGTHLLRCAGISDSSLPANQDQLEQTLEKLNGMNFAVLDTEAGDKMQQAILEAKAQLDSVGGILETAVTGLEPGLGEPFFSSVESVLASLFFSIPAVKGIEFGLGFGFADLKGSQGNDPFRIEEDKIYTTTNHNGGINGGITNGMPVVFRSVIKPTASISQPQDTVDIAVRENAELRLKGRHDPCILHRARAVADAMTAIGLLDLFTQRYGTLWHTAGKTEEDSKTELN